MLRLASDLGPKRARFSRDQACALILIVTSEVFADFGYPAEITGGNEDGHRTQMHPEGRAFDFRVKHVLRSGWEPIRDEMKRRLGPDFDVLLELRPPHVHVEHDPKP